MTSSARLLIAVAGPMGSGKSSISRALANEMGGHRRSYGDAVRAQARLRGLEESREALQDLGEALIKEGWPAFTSMVLDTVAEDVDLVVIDGVRHMSALDHLTRASPDRRVISLFIAAGERERVKRLVERDGLPVEEIERAMVHPNEQEVTQMAELVDLVVINDNRVDIPALAARVRLIRDGS
jgi:cytidylate kinase